MYLFFSCIGVVVVVVVAVVFVRRRRCRRRCRLRRRLVVVATVAQIQEKVIISFQLAFLNKSFSALAELVLRVVGAHSPSWRRSALVGVCFSEVTEWPHWPSDV